MVRRISDLLWEMVFSYEKVEKGTEMAECCFPFGFASMCCRFGGIAVFLSERFFGS